MCVCVLKIRSVVSVTKYVRKFYTTFVILHDVYDFYACKKTKQILSTFFKGETYMFFREK